MEYAIIGGAIALISFLVGLSQGYKRGKQAVLRILNIPPGYTIDAVSYRKLN